MEAGQICRIADLHLPEGSSVRKALDESIQAHGCDCRLPCLALDARFHMGMTIICFCAE